MRPISALLVIGSALVAPALSASPVAAQSTPTIDKILERGQVTIGHRPSSPPFGYVNDKGEVVGYTVEICRYVVEQLKTALNRPDLRTAYVPADPSNRIPLVQNGTIDLECATTGNTVERQKIVAFSYSTIFPDARFAVRRSSGIASVKDLKGRSVAVLQGTVQQRQLTELDRELKLGIKPVLAKDTAENFLLLETGRVDAALNDPILLSTYIAKSRDAADLTFVPDWSGQPENDAIMMAKGDDRFRSLVNAAIKKMMDSGEFTKNYEKWLMAPPYNLPMNEALKKQMANPTDDPTTL